jgi:uncharacterized phiE125 gp8 family phage protein
MGLRLITPPATEPITLQEAKDHLRVTTTDNDAKITRCITEARQYVETFLSRALIEQTWDLYLDQFPIDGDIKIPLPPLIAVNSVSYFDSGGVGQILPAAQYYVDTISQPGWLVLAGGGSWPTTLAAVNSVIVRFRAGYVTADSPPLPAVPFDIQAAILMAIGVRYEMREDTVLGQSATSLPQGCQELLIRHRVDLGYW